jgi:hypothetical protein
MTADNGAGPVFLDRAQMLALADHRSEVCEVPEWQGAVRVGTWTGATRWRILRLWQEEERATNLLAVVAAASVVDAQGVRVFSDEDIPALALKNAQALQRIFDVALRVNGMAPAAVADLGKGSGATPSGASPSGSPSPSA